MEERQWSHWFRVVSAMLWMISDGHFGLFQQSLLIMTTSRCWTFSELSLWDSCYSHFPSALIYFTDLKTNILGVFKNVHFYLDHSPTFQTHILNCQLTDISTEMDMSQTELQISPPFCQISSSYSLPHQRKWQLYSFSGLGQNPRVIFD